MASTPIIKQEWIDATQHLKAKERAEVLGAIYLFLLSGERVSASTNNANICLHSLFPIIERSAARTKIYRENIGKRWNHKKEDNCIEIVNDLYDTNSDTNQNIKPNTKLDTNPNEYTPESRENKDGYLARRNYLSGKSEEIYNEKLQENTDQREDFSLSPPDPPISHNSREESLFNNNKTLPGRDKSSLKPTGNYDLSFIESEEMREVVSDWLDYKRRRKQSYKTPESLRQMVNKLATLSQGDPGVAREIINDAIANNYAGFFALKNNNRQYGNNDYRQRLGLGGGADAGYVPDYSESSIAVPRH